MPETFVMFLSLGANVRGRWGAPARTLGRAVWELAALEGVEVAAVSGLWRCAPFGRLLQPPFFNAVVEVRTVLMPWEMMKRLARLEQLAGRRRGAAWGARALDIDLLAVVRPDGGGMVARPVGMGGRARGREAHVWQRRGLVLPHPGVAERAFVLLPLAEVAPDWRHPPTGAMARMLLARLPARERAECRPCSIAMCSQSGVNATQWWRGY